MDSAWQKNMLFEQRFWLAIMKDHTEFILDALSSRETEEIEKATCLLRRFEELSQKPEQLARSEQATKELRQFKLHLLRRQLTDDLRFALSPTFINHMVNELDEYLRILSFLIKCEQPPPLHSLHHHLLWLPDAAGHAESLDMFLDGTEKPLKWKSRSFTRTFEAFYLKAIELTGFLRTGLTQYPALAKFNQDVRMELVIFQQFLKELEEWRITKEVLGIFGPKLADHMFREECYYLQKLAESGGTKPPPCSPLPKETESSSHA